MNNSRHIRPTFSILIVLCLAVMLPAQDISGAADHPVISRYPGSKIISFYKNDYNELKYAVRPAAAEENPKVWKAVKGKHTSIVYEAPAGKTTVEIMKNYRDAITAKGGEILFECTGGECDGTDAWYSAKFFNGVYMSDSRSGGGVSHYEHFDAYHQAQRYLVAQIPTSDKNYVLEIGMTPKYDHNPVKICLEIVAEEKMETGLIKVNADVIEEKLNKNGKIALYGIFFDTGKASLKSESQKELDEIVKYLKRKHGENLYIVGHTDDTGSISTNLSLSEARARAVTTYLGSKGISSNRLDARGVASFAPVSTNETEKGRALNRRVELVRKIK